MTDRNCSWVCELVFFSLFFRFEMENVRLEIRFASKSDWFFVSFVRHSVLSVSHKNFMEDDRLNGDREGTDEPVHQSDVPLTGDYGCEEFILVNNRWLKSLHPKGSRRKNKKKKKWTTTRWDAKFKWKSGQRFGKGALNLNEKRTNKNKQIQRRAEKTKKKPKKKEKI